MIWDPDREDKRMDASDMRQVKGMRLLKQTAPKFFARIVKKCPEFIDAIEEMERREHSEFAARMAAQNKMAPDGMETEEELF